MVDKVSRNNFDTSDNCLFANEREEMQTSVENNYKLHMFYSVPNRKSAVFINIFEEMEALDKKYNLNVFKMHLRLAESDKQRWNADFVQSKLEKEKSDVTRFYLAGPVPFMDDIKDAILSTGTGNREQIIFV